MAVQEQEQEQVVDLDQLDREVAAEMERLGDLVASRALAALRDPRVQSDLLESEALLREASRRREQLVLAREQLAREQASAAAEAERARVERALARAVALAPDIDRAEREIDAALAAVAPAVLAWFALLQERDTELTVAGRAPSASAPRMHLIRLHGAFVDATRSLPRGVLHLEGGPPQPKDWRPLAGDVVQASDEKDGE